MTTADTAVHENAAAIAAAVVNEIRIVMEYTRSLAYHLEGRRREKRKACLDRRRLEE